MTVVLCADTTVAVGRRILGKPADIAPIKRVFSARYVGAPAPVITAVAVRKGDASLGKGCGHRQ